MYIPFEQLPGDSRVWVYQSDRTFTEKEASIVSKVLKDFCNEWAAHGIPLQTSFVIKNNRFIILSVNENVNDASGCSIDGSVRVLKEIGQQLGVDFFNRTQIAFLKNGNVQTYAIHQLNSLFQSGELNAQSATFNNLVATKADFDKNWEAQVENSWLAKYLPKTALSV